MIAKEEQVREVKRRHSPRLLSKPGVAGVGIEKDDSGEYVLAVHLASDDPETVKGLPEEIEGVPVKYIHSGPFRKLDKA